MLQIVALERMLDISKVTFPVRVARNTVWDGKGMNTACYIRPDTGASRTSDPDTECEQVEDPWDCLVSLPSILAADLMKRTRSSYGIRQTIPHHPMLCMRANNASLRLADQQNKMQNSRSVLADL